MVLQSADRKQNFAHLLVFFHPCDFYGEAMSAAHFAKHKPALRPSRSGPHTVAPEPRLSDAQIAADATRQLAWDAAVPEHSVKVSVSHGRITLTGELQRDQQRRAVLEDVSRLFGVTGVSDRTVVKAPQPAAKKA
jgi:osmotically-inducible protein OsmY